MTQTALIAVCGLHGGAGTTSVAHLVADTLAADNPAGTVLLCETDPIGGDLADRIQASSFYSLSELAHLRGRRAALTSAPFTELPTGLRLIAAATAERQPASNDLVAEVLTEARGAHQVTIVDCGTLREPHAWSALAIASHVIWVTRADTPPAAIAAKLASPLAQPAQVASWLLTIAASSTQTDASIDALQAAAPTTQGTVLVGDLASLPADDERRLLAGQHLVSALT